MAPNTVLVVEDVPALTDLLCCLLSAHGFLFHVAADTVEAVQLLLRHGPAIDLVLLDGSLGGAWPGPLALVAVRAFAPAVPCCVLAGGVSPEGEEGLGRLGAAAVWPKPLGDLDEFARRLRELAGGSRRV